MEQEIQNALKTLRAGGIILYPTDTIWGIGCDATNEKAVEKIFTIKKRIESKSLITLVSDDGMLNRFVKEVPEMAWDLLDTNNSTQEDEPSKRLTIIYDSARGIAKNILAADGSIGIRIVRLASQGGNDFCHRLIHKFGKPIVSTSANISGVPAPGNFLEISDEIIKSVDYVVNWMQHDSSNSLPSSIIKLKANGEFKIIRE
jgi:L-threonylcarbamoyladenylate synthase